MGYSTDFEGQFDLDRPLTVEHLRILEDFAKDDHRGEPGVPGVYCDWVPTRDGAGIKWGGGEKFYDYIPWIKYLIDRFLAPWGYTVNGSVQWQGEELGDIGVIEVNDNVVSSHKFVVSRGKVSCPSCGHRFDPKEG